MTLMSPCAPFASKRFLFLLIVTGRNHLLQLETVPALPSYQEWIWKFFVDSGTNYKICISNLHQ